MPDPLLAAGFALAAAVSLLASWRLVRSLECVGGHLELSEALLGMLAALAADAPEITSAVTALAHHDQRIGAGVVIGSNVFNLAALIGLSGIVAGSVALHRRSIELSGAVAVWFVLCTLAVVLGWCAPGIGLAAALAVFVPYLIALGTRRQRLHELPLLAPVRAWLAAAIHDEELELEVAIHPRRSAGHHARAALAATAVVVLASVAMEQAAAKLGSRHGVPEIVTGGLVLAAVTSLPNAVAGVYLAGRGRGAAALSTSLNSNTLNVLAGMLVPTTLLGIARPSGQTTFIALGYAAMTLLAVGACYAQRGMRRSAGIVIVSTYAAFVAVLLSI
jgi:cation:H+ antiporter